MHSLHLRWLSSLDQRKRGIGWATAHYKVIRWLLSLARGGQSVITYFFVDKLSELQISLVGELSSAITLILMRRAGNSHSAETSKINSSHGRVTVEGCRPRNCFQEENLFRLYSTHLQSKNMIYLLTLFWNNFLNLTFFLVIKLKLRTAGLIDECTLIFRESL